jgi:hypothetical protein
MSRKPVVDTGFAEIAALIASAKVRAFQAVNTALIDLYWQVGGIISRKIAVAEWAWWTNWRHTSRAPIPACGASPAGIFSGCGSFTTPGRIMN